jgi:hypothetical protein
MASQIEFELWVENNPFNDIQKAKTKPANASKADKTLRKAKAIRPENNPRLTSATLGVIDSFFNDDDE